jgi:hypothetical protein
MATPKKAWVEYDPDEGRVERFRVTYVVEYEGSNKNLHEYINEADERLRETGYVVNEPTDTILIEKVI